MATTTNYGWSTPDDVSLVKDGASAIRTLGSSIDTTTKNLNPSTTAGDIEYRSSTPNVNTRLPLGTAGQVLKVNSGATAPEWSSDNAGMTNPMTTTGDTIYSSSGSTPARLGIGSTGQVLTVSGGVPSWTTVSSGGMTLLSTTSLSGATTTISSISQDYINLFAIITGVTNATASGQFYLEPNDDDNFQNSIINAGTTMTLVSGNLAIVLSDTVNAMKLDLNTNVFTVMINNYASSTTFKTFSTEFGYVDSGDNRRYGGAKGYARQTDAITSLVFRNSGGNLSTGTVRLYGVK
jgi:hypothetical protein